LYIPYFLSLFTERAQKHLHSVSRSIDPMTDVEIQDESEASGGLKNKEVLNEERETCQKYTTGRCS
jgi:hypothetical protein